MPSVPGKRIVVQYYIVPRSLIMSLTCEEKKKKTDNEQAKIIIINNNNSNNNKGEHRLHQGSEISYGCIARMAGSINGVSLARVD